MSRDPAEVHRSTADLAVLADPARCASRSRGRAGARGAGRRAPATPAPPAPRPPASRSRAGHVSAGPRRAAPANAIVIEESPSSRSELIARLPARASLGSLSPAMGGSASRSPPRPGCDWRCPSAPVVAIVGDGASLYSIQALWSAAQYGAGALFVILSNGGYAIMDRLAEHHGGTGPWPSVESTSSGLRRRSAARRAGSPSTTSCSTRSTRSCRASAGRKEPLLLEVVVAPDATFTP